MRIGFNPQKDKEQEPSGFFHQVVIPVYIPSQDGYFKDGFDILKLCLNSLFKTCHDKTYFTVVNNGSCDAVKIYLDELFNMKNVHEVIHTSNIGKLNAVLKGLAGNQFTLITITDADVLFLNNWQEEAYAVFEAFPKAGSVSPCPNSKALKYYTANILLEKVVSESLRFSNVKNPKAMQSFADSIGNFKLFNIYNLKKYLTVTNNGIEAVVGGGHFVMTYRSAIFHKLSQLYSNFKLGGESEREFLDKPVSFKGYWRLSTADNYAYHMGNTLEDWMPKQVENLKENNFVHDKAPQLAKVKSYTIVNWFRIKVFSKILFRKSIWRLFLRYKGLTKEEATAY
ncbi:glycosyltransferase family 2 protein [Flavobacterium sp. IMCC34518]|uniref:glycosyltransferase n=1 Tax=Flavobacterium sp. IMCC34518 TaxID=3003623 RepID=UPI00248295DE|nr:glycosyltransferase family 2 protein [Flavobacterium sp. IMCC34518]